MIKVIIAGGRNFTDLEGLRKVFEEWFKDKSNDEVTVISDCAKGADQIGEKIAEMYGLKVERYRADWDRYGKSAGYKRNVVMAQNATHLLAAWDGKSKGTKHMINIAECADLVVKIYSY